MKKKLILTLMALAIASISYLKADSVEGETCGTKHKSIDCSTPGADCTVYWTNGGHFSWTTSGTCHDTMALGIDSGCNCQ